jgi:hypothetical protein
VKKWWLATATGGPLFIESDNIKVHEGALLLSDEEGNITTAYAPGEWKVLQKAADDE